MNPDTDSTGSTAYEMFLNCSVPLNDKIIKTNLKLVYWKCNSNKKCWPKNNFFLHLKSPWFFYLSPYSLRYYSRTGQ